MIGDAGIVHKGEKTMIKRVKQLDEVLDFAWELSQNKLYASYHRLTSIDRIQEYIEKAIGSEYERIIASYHQGVLSGLCIYFWIPDEKYAQTIMFLIQDKYDEIADGLIAYIGEQLPGYELFICVPFSNTNANQYFKKRNYSCIDSLIDTRLYNLQANVNPNHDLVEQITKDNFGEYKTFHDQQAVPLEMYYTSRNLEKEIDRFRIFVFREAQRIRGSIFVKTGEKMPEIFGLFIDDGWEGRNIHDILLAEVLMQLYNEFGGVKEITYLIDEDSSEELSSALSAGFSITDTCRCYKCIF